MRNHLVLALLSIAAVQAAQPQRIDQLLWQKPGRVETLDLFHGSGGRGGVPREPFRLLREEKGGTSKKVLVRDGANRTWEVKFGPEGKAEVFATRLVWALGYYADPTYLVRKGHISGKPFTDARFELRKPYARFRPELQWDWERNPFTGSRELNGLRIVVMLLSNWDNKDSRNSSSNTGVLEQRTAPRVLRHTYYLTDWGASMGRWGGFFTREKWDCEGFAAQTSKLVREVDGNEVLFGYTGKHSRDFKQELTTDDVRWIMQYLGRVRDSQLSAALRAAGASEAENACFTRSLRTRIEALRRSSAVTSARRW